jgi:hypothetical protein
MGRFIAVVVIASLLASFSDWLFMGVLFHDRYNASPEIWRATGGRGNRAAILYSQVIGVVSCAAFSFLCLQVQALSIAAALACALLVWLAGPAVVLAQMVIWTKLHPLIGVSQSIGWLARFAITGLLAAWWL